MTIDTWLEAVGFFKRPLDTLHILLIFAMLNIIFSKKIFPTARRMAHDWI